jgi:hypothetical protein
MPLGVGQIVKYDCGMMGKFCSNNPGKPSSGNTSGGGGSGLVPIIAGSCAALLVALLILGYQRRKTDQGDSSLGESLLDNDGLEMNKLPPASPLAQHGASSQANITASMYPVAVGAAAQPAAVCKVLITGAASANIRSIEVGDANNFSRCF